MAKIIYSHLSPISEDETDLAIFHESFVKELSANGNEVLVLNTHFFNKDPFCGQNELKKDINRDSFEEKIRVFNPDLVICLNNNTYDRIHDVTSCPIIYWAADSIKLFSQKKKIVNDDRNFFLTNAEITRKEFVDFGIEKKRAFVLDQATAVRSEELEQDKNISFIGSSFWKNKKFVDYIDSNPGVEGEFRAYLEYFLRKNDYDVNVSLSKLGLKKIGDYFSDENNLFPFIDLRPATIISLLDVGIRVYGPEWSNYFCNTVPWVAVAHSKARAVSLKENQDVYNSSKLCLNVNHPQCGLEGFSWRVYDIMASNGCLLSNYNSTLKRIFSDQGVDLPMYNSPYEARQIAGKLLTDKNLRCDIVEAGQSYIDKNNLRWNRVVKEVEQIVGVRVSEVSNSSGKISFFMKEDFLSAIGNLNNFMNSVVRAECYSKKEESGRVSKARKPVFVKCLKEFCKIFPYFLVKNFFNR